MIVKDAKDKGPSGIDFNEVMISFADQINGLDFGADEKKFFCLTLFDGVKYFKYFKYVKQRHGHKIHNLLTSPITLSLV